MKHQLPPNYRIMVNGHGNYWIEEKYWFFWNKVCSYSYHYDCGWVKKFNSKESACAYVQDIIKAKAIRAEGRRKDKDIRNAGPC